jgi:hypothetical protein
VIFNSAIDFSIFTMYPPPPPPKVLISLNVGTFDFFPKMPSTVFLENHEQRFWRNLARIQQKLSRFGEISPESGKNSPDSGEISLAFFVVDLFRA